jgi:hypothetical protein
VSGHPSVDEVNLDLSGPGGALKVFGMGGTLDIVGPSLKAIAGLRRFRGLQTELRRRFQINTEFRIFLKTRQIARVAPNGTLRPTPVDFLFKISRPLQ